MKKSRLLFTAIWLIAWAIPCQAQSTGAMLEQLATLKEYIREAEKGYQIAKQGLATIRDIKNGEFTLHQLFFSSLKTVNPVIKQEAPVAEVIGLQESLAKRWSGRPGYYRQNAWLHPGEVSYIEQVYKNSVNAGTEAISALQDLVTDGRLEMTDGDRIKRIQQIESDMQEVCRFVQAFIDKTDWLIRQRQKESAETGAIIKAIH